MCGRYAIRVDAETLAQRFHLTAPELPLPDDLAGPRYNVAPTQRMAIVVRDAEGAHARPMRWGLVPRWAKDPSGGAKMINARSETLIEKPTFRPLVRTRRCVVPASGFYEWDRATRTPYFIHLKGEPVLGFAGLYDIWSGPDGTVMPTYTIITTAANETIAPIHDRMPAILRPEDEDDWLDPANTKPEEVLPLLRPYAPTDIALYKVSRDVNSPRNDREDLLLPLGA
ncbi:MAG TPA: SOS response-associated peptidase [Ktedonobacterales bacterium]|jgi:putative SOS response-associated peptidase YedK